MCGVTGQHDTVTFSYSVFLSVSLSLSAAHYLGLSQADGRRWREQTFQRLTDVCHCKLKSMEELADLFHQEVAGYNTQTHTDTHTHTHTLTHTHTHTHTLPGAEVLETA